MDDLWDIIFTQQPRQEGLRGFGVPMPLKEDIEHEPVLVHGPPKPVSNAVHARTHLVEMPPGTPTGFPVVQVFSEEGSELDTPLAEGLVTDLNAALMQQFLHVSVTQGKAVVEPNSLLDDGHRETVAVGFSVSHGGSAYPEPVKATQPLPVLVGLNMPFPAVPDSENRHQGTKQGRQVVVESMSAPVVAGFADQAMLSPAATQGGWKNVLQRASVLFLGMMA